MAEMDPNPGQGNVGQVDEAAEEPAAAVRLNPLLLPNVLKRILECSSLSKQDLINMRAVCRTWREEATKAYSKRLFMHFGENMASVTKMFVFMDLIQEPLANMPFPTSLGIDSSFFCQHKKMLKTMQRYFENFLQIVAPTLEEISFAVHTSSEVDLEFKSFQVILQFPKLKGCAFFLNESYGQEQSMEYLSRACAMVLGSSPMLERIKICSNLRHSRSEEAIESGDKMLDEELLRQIPRTVKDLFLHKPLRQTTAQIMSELALPVLETLTIEAPDSHLLSHSDFNRIFNGCLGSLKTLKIDHYVGGVQFRPMPRLTNLTLNVGAYNSSEPEAEHHSVRPFTQLFPAVTELHIPEIGNLGILNSLFPQGFHAPLVESCCFPDIATIKPETTLNLALGFTGLKKINMSPLRPLQILPIIFGNMGGLEEIYIKFRSNLHRTCGDAALTGIPGNLCSAIRAESLWNIDLRAVKLAPGLSDLTNLKTLRIQRCPRRKLFISDVSGYLGILKNESLTKLSCNEFEMTEDCLNKIKARFGEGAIQDPPYFALPPDMLQPNNNFMELPVLEGEDEEAFSDEEFPEYDVPYFDDDSFEDDDNYSGGGMEYFDNDFDEFN